MSVKVKVEGDGLKFNEVIGEGLRDFVLGEGNVVFYQGDEASSGFVWSVGSDGGIAGEGRSFVLLSEFGLLQGDNVRVVVLDEVVDFLGFVRDAVGVKLEN